MSTVQAFAFGFAPKNWLPCAGQLLAIQTNQALFSLLGTTYGGNGTTTFALPDLRGRAPMHSTNATGSGLTSRTLGERSGSETVTLLTTQMPLHTHTAVTTASQPCQSAAGNNESPAGTFPAANAPTANTYSSTSNATMGAPTVSTTINPAGGSQAHPNLPPYLTLNFCIAVFGVFPSRN
jgi:microcystin-dependent protein